MIVLTVVAHPDDESLGMGGMIARLVSEGHAVSVLALADGVTSRAWGTVVTVNERTAQQRKAAEVLGCEWIDGPSWPDQRLDTIPVLTLTRHIEAQIEKLKPVSVFTHSPHDCNADHRRTFEAVEPAVRPKSGVSEVYCFEGPRMRRFHPTAFWALSEQQVMQQIEAMRCYGDELQRELLLVRARAIEYGYRAGCQYAAGFETIRCLN